MAKIKLIGTGCVSRETLDRNKAHAETLGLPSVTTAAERLAVVGGGASIAGHVEELRAFDGEIWAVNGAALWCSDNGIDAAFCTFDPMPQNAPPCRRGLVGLGCDPSLFADLGDRAEILPGTLEHGPTTATAIPMIAITIGVREVTFFGCESSFSERSHAYEHEEQTTPLTVRVGGVDYQTKAEFLMQAQMLAEIIAAFPHVFKERSGGMLRALVQSGGEHDVISGLERAA